MKEIEIFEDILDIEEKLNTDISSGLSRKASRERAIADGVTDTSFFVRRKRNFISCFLGVVKMLPAAILTLVAVAAFFMGRAQLAIAVLSTFISSSIISGMLYLSAQRGSERMEVYSNPTVRVLRDGREYITDCRNLVVGDVLILRSGDYIPADLCVVESSGLCVSEIFFDKEIGYADRNIADGFDGEGRLLAGSFVKGGCAKAVVTAVGEDVRMSEHIRAGGLAKKNTDPLVIKRTYRSLSGVAFILSVAALILAIVGMFTAKQVGILEIFLVYLSLILSMTLVSSPIAGRILLSAMLKRSTKGGADYAIIKNNRAIDSLPYITDAIVCGTFGITDGEQNLSSMLLYGEHLCDIGAADPSDFIFECMYSFVKARGESGDAADNERKELDGLARGIARTGFDSEAADVRIRSLYFGALMDGRGVACVEMAQMSFRVYVGDDVGFIDSCQSVRKKDGKVGPLGDFVAIAKKYIDEADGRGERVYAVISEIDGERILEGLVGFREGICQSFAETKSVLSQKGVATSVMLCDGGEYSKYYLRAVGFDDEHIIACHGDEPEMKPFGCAYVGYSAEQYAELIAKMKSEGRIVAALGVDDKYGRSYGNADVVITCDNINYGSRNYRESEILARAADGCGSSQRCSQELRTRADVIVSRGSAESGGLRGVFEAVKCAESFSHNYLQMILLLVSFEAVLVIVTLMSFISGISIISYPAILLLCVALVFFTVAAFSTFKPRAFDLKSSAQASRLFRAAIGKLIPPFIATAVFFAVALYLDASGYIVDMAAIPLATTLGVIATFVLSFFGSMRECIGKRIDMTDIKSFTEKDKSRGGFLNVAAMTLVLTSVIRMILTALVIPSIATEYGYVGVCAETFILLGVYVATFAVCSAAVWLARAILTRIKRKHK